MTNTNMIIVESVTFTGGVDTRCWLLPRAPGFLGRACSAFTWTRHALDTLDGGLDGAKRRRR